MTAASKNHFIAMSWAIKLFFCSVMNAVQQVIFSHWYKCWNFRQNTSLFSMWMCFMQIHSGDNGKFKWINNVHAAKRAQVSGMNKLRSLLRGNQAFKALSAKQLNMKSRITFVFILFSLTSYLSLFSLYKLFFKAIKLLDFLCFTLRGKRSKQ